MNAKNILQSIERDISARSSALAMQYFQDSMLNTSDSSPIVIGVTHNSVARQAFSPEPKNITKMKASTVTPTLLLTDALGAVLTPNPLATAVARDALPA